MYLPCCDKQAEHDGTNPYAKHSVNQKTTEEAKDDIGP